MSNENTTVSAALPGSTGVIPGSLASMLPRPAAIAVTRAGRWLTGLGRPAMVLLVTTTLAAIALGAWLTVTSTHVAYAPLFSQLQRDDAAAMIEKLRELHVPYRLSADGATIEVPAAQVPETRLSLASAGLPRGGGVGMEGFDHMRLGATEMEQRVLYHRALEGELARSIATLAAVQAARVHLVFQERSVFVSRAEPSSASILVTLRPGARLDRGQIAGMVHLVSAAVPGLDDNRVALMTTDGLTLHRPRAGSDDPSAAGSTEMDEERGLQSDVIQTSIEDRVRAMLDRVVGAEHVDVRATVEIDLARVERTEDHYDPERAVLRSEEATTERVSPPDNSTVSGVPGAQSNLPTSPSVGSRTTAGALGPGVTRESHTRNFEVDRVTERRVQTQGALHRLTVAVVLDGVAHTENGHTTMVPRPQEELDRITALVRSAVGYDEHRGDLVTVQSVPFLTSTPAAVTALASAARRPATAARRRTWRTYLPAAGAALALVLVALGATVIARRRAAANEVHDAEEIEAGLLGDPRPRVVALPGSSPETLEEIRSAAHNRAAMDPATAALVLRFWLGADSSERVAADTGSHGAQAN